MCLEEEGARAGQAEQAQGKEQKAVVAGEKSTVAIKQKDGQSQSAKGAAKGKNKGKEGKGARGAKQKQKQNQSVEISD